MHVTAGWRRWAARKFPLTGNQSRHTNVESFRALLDLSNELSAGLLRAPKIRVHCAAVGAFYPPPADADDDQINDNQPPAEWTGEQQPDGDARANDANSEQRRRQHAFLATCDESVCAALQRLSCALHDVCRALNTLATSTYQSDAETGGAFMNLINYATLQRERIDTWLAAKNRQLADSVVANETK